MAKTGSSHTVAASQVWHMSALATFLEQLSAFTRLSPLEQAGQACKGESHGIDVSFAC